MSARDSRPGHGRAAPRRGQRGVAIITAMLVVALGTVTMVAISARQQLDLQRERNEGLIQLGRSFGVSGERFAAALLYRDRQQGDRENTDSLDDDWAATIPPVPIDAATIQGCIVDMQGKFNLNNLVDAAGNPVPLYIEQLGRLLAELGIEVSKAQAIVDWLDQDIDPLIPDGAEDDYYTSLDPAYRTANAPLVSLSELRLIKGFGTLDETEQEDYELLLPHVAALPKGPDGQATRINVNTATPEVIVSVDPDYKAFATDLSRWDTGAYEDYPECEDIFDLSADDAPETIEQDRDLQPYLSAQEFRALAGGEAPVERTETVASEPEFDPNTGELIEPDPESPPPDGGDGVPIEVSSRWFEVRIDVILEGLRLSQFTLFERDDEGRTRIVRRTRDTL